MPDLRTKKGSLFLALAAAAALIALSGSLSWAAHGSAAAETREGEEHVSAPERVVSTVLSSDEILLDLEIGSRLIAVGMFAADPISSHVSGHNRLPNARVTADAEAIVALEPDLVFLSQFARPETTAMLRRVHAPIYPLPTCTAFACIEELIASLGEAVGRVDRARALVDQMNFRLEQVELQYSGQPSPTVLLYQRGGYTAGAGTLFDEMVQRAGGQNAAALLGLSGHQPLDLETLFAMDPDVILVNDYRADGTAASYGEAPLVVGNPMYESLTAVQHGRAYAISPKYILSSSHYAALGVARIGELIHQAQPGPAARANE